MSDTLVHSHPGLVDVYHRTDLDAVNLVWHSEYDEGSAVRHAVMAAVAFVKNNDIKHWLADISNSTAALSDADLEWVNGSEFRGLIADSPLEKFVLMPPLPHTGQDIGWLDEWESSTLRAFDKGKSAKLSGNMNEIRAFFGVTKTGE